MVKTLSNKIEKRTAQERIIKYFVYHEPELLGNIKKEKNKIKIKYVESLLLEPFSIIWTYQNNSIKN
jgi:hypothetical protein